MSPSSPRAAWAVLSALVVGCAASPPPSPPAARCDALEAQRWLLGRWCGAHRGGTFCETWREAGASFAGQGALERDGVTLSTETLRLELREGALRYVATPQGEGETAFRLVRCGPREAVFENLAHDFPTRLRYRRDGEEALEVSVEGPADGGERVISFHLRRE